MLLARVAERLEVAGLRHDEPDVHHHGLQDHRRDLARVVSERLLDRLGIVERHDDHGLPQRLRDALRRGLGGVPGLVVLHAVAEAQHVGLGDHGEQHRVVVTVVRALHLDDLVAAGRGPGHADRVHRRLGARVHEPHLLELEPRADLLGQRDRRLGGHREVDALVGDLADRLDDLRVGMADHVHAEPAVEVGVLGAVDVPHARARSTLEVHGVRVSGLEVRRHAGRQALQGPLVERLRPGRPVEQDLRLSFGDLGRASFESVQVSHALPPPEDGQRTRAATPEAI